MTGFSQHAQRSQAAARAGVAGGLIHQVPIFPCKHDNSGKWKTSKSERLHNRPRSFPQNS